MYSVQFTVYSVQCIGFSIQCTVYSVQHTMYSIHCTQYTVYSVHSSRLLSVVSALAQSCHSSDGGAAWCNTITRTHPPQANTYTLHYTLFTVHCTTYTVN